MNAPAGGTPVSRFVIVALHVLAAALVLRAVLIFVGANVEQPLVAALVSFTQPLAGAFAGIFPQPSDAAGVIPIDLGALLAAVALEVAGFGLRALAREAASVP